MQELGAPSGLHKKETANAQSLCRQVRSVALNLVDECSSSTCCLVTCQIRAELLQADVGGRGSFMMGLRMNSRMLARS